MSALHEQETTYNARKLSEDELRTQWEFVERRIESGITEHNAFDLLEAESVLSDIGPFSPDESVVELVLEQVSGKSFYDDFDLLRICGYLHNTAIKELLERNFTALRDIWKAQDEIRFYESNRIMLSNVIRRAQELNALKVAADPYMQTMDSFFERSFSSNRLEKFSDLIEVRDNLYRLRNEGNLSKNNLMAVLNVAKDKLAHMVQAKMDGLAAKFTGDLPKPNRVIALYYCLLEALMNQKSDLVEINEEFLEKVEHDFRAAGSAGTRRFVLNSLLKIRHTGFAETAAEARFVLREKTLEDLGRRDDGEPGYKRIKVTFDEQQNYELFKTAATIIARNPSGEVFRTLLNSYNVPALLLGLRALREADMPALRKFSHVKRLFDLGTVNEYVFAKAIELVGELKIPTAMDILSRVLTERYGWRKATIPDGTYNRIIDGIYNGVSSAQTFIFAEAILKRREALRETGDDAHLDEEWGASLTFPYEPKVYLAAINTFANRVEKNPFHGLNEMAQHRLFEAMLAFIFKTRVSYSFASKRKALAVIRKLNQVSSRRLEVFAQRLRKEYEQFTLRDDSVAENELIDYRNLLLDIKQTISVLVKSGVKPEREESLLRRLLPLLNAYLETKMPGRNTVLQVKHLLESLVSIGPALMKKRDENVRLSAADEERVNLPMLSYRYPGASSTIIRLEEPLIQYYEKTKNKHAMELLKSMNVFKRVQLQSLKITAPAVEKYEDLWMNLQVRLESPMQFEEMLKFRMTISLVTAGAVAHKRMRDLDKLRFYLYNAPQPDEARFAFLSLLPVEREFAAIWEHVLPCENEATLVALRRSLSAEDREKLGIIVPDLLDLLE